MVKIKMLEIEVNGLKYRLLCQFRFFSKLKHHIDKYIEKSFNISILKYGDMYRMYGYERRPNIRRA